MSEQEEPEFDLKTALESLSDLVESYNSEIYIPSKKEKITVNEINASQQKELLSAAIDNSLFNTNFINVFYKILSDLLGEEIVNTLTIFDKASIAIGIRKQISNILKVQKDENSEKFDISLSDVINRFESYIHPTTAKFGNKKLAIAISIPTILLEKEYESQMHRKDKTVEEIKTTKDIKEIVSKEFLGELSKYIRVVKIETATFEFEKLTFPQRILVVEKLPSSLIQEILTKITIWKKELDSVLTIKLPDSSDYIIKIDPLLFVN
jgi:hypothetical protein